MRPPHRRRRNPPRRLHTRRPCRVCEARRTARIRRRSALRPGSPSGRRMRRTPRRRPSRHRLGRARRRLRRSNLRPCSSLRRWGNSPSRSSRSLADSHCTKRPPWSLRACRARPRRKPAPRNLAKDGRAESPRRTPGLRSCRPHRGSPHFALRTARTSKSRGRRPNLVRSASRSRVRDRDKPRCPRHTRHAWCCPAVRRRSECRRPRNRGPAPSRRRRPRATGPRGGRQSAV